MELKSKFYLLDDEGNKIMGIGIVWLLEGVIKTSSLRKAALEMDLSYSKAVRMIANLEKGLGREVLVRRKGGNERAGSEITPFGLEFLELYKQFTGEAKTAIEKPFSEFDIKLKKLLEENQK